MKNNNNVRKINLGGESINVVPNFQRNIKEPSINKEDLQFDFKHHPHSDQVDNFIQFKTQPGTRPENYQFTYNNSSNFQDARNNNVKVKGALPPQNQNRQGSQQNDLQNLQQLNQQNKPFRSENYEQEKQSHQNRDLYTPTQISTLVSNGQKMQVVDMNVGHGGSEEDAKAYEQRTEYKDDQRGSQNSQMKQGGGVEIEGLQKRNVQKQQPGNPFINNIIEGKNEQRQNVKVNSSQQNNMNSQNRHPQSEVKSNQYNNYNNQQRSEVKSNQYQNQGRMQQNSHQPGDYNNSGMQRKTSQAEFYVSRTSGNNHYGFNTTNYQTSTQGDRRQIKLQSQKESVLSQLRNKLGDHQQLKTKEQIQRDTESIKQRFSQQGFNLRSDHGDYRVYRVNEDLFNPEPRTFNTKDIKITSSVVNTLPSKQFSQSTRYT